MRSRVSIGLVTLAVTALVSAGTTPARADLLTAGTYNPLASERIVNTTTGKGVPKAMIAPGKSVTFGVLGGIERAKVGTVDLTITAISPTKNGYLTAYAADLPTRPGVSTLTFTAGESTPNDTAIPIFGTKKVTVYNGSTAPVGLAVDRIGFWTSGAPDQNRYGTYTSFTSPTRAVDTRQSQKLEAGAKTSVSLGSLGLPANTVAVTVNLGVVTPGGNGYLVASAPGAGAPTGITVAFSAARTRSNFAMVQLGGDGEVVITNGAKVAVDFTLDVFGYYAGGSQANFKSGQTQVLSGPTREQQQDGSGVLSLLPGETGSIGSVDGVFGAVTVHVTAYGATKTGFVTVYGSGTPRPNSSVTNYYPNTARTGTITVPASGPVLIYNGGASTVKINIDYIAILSGDPE